MLGDFGEGFIFFGWIVLGSGLFLTLDILMLTL